MVEVWKIPLRWKNQKETIYKNLNRGVEIREHYVSWKYYIESNEREEENKTIDF